MRRALIGALAAALLVAPTAGAWTWPVDGPVLQRFVFGSDPYAAGQHRGIDIGAPSGSQVLAAATGTVSFSGTVPGSGTSVTIQTPDAYSVTLTHLGSSSARRGADVHEGDVIGTVGPSGVVEQDVPYVHLGVRRSEDPNGYVDPLLFLPTRSAPPAVAAPPAPPASPLPPASPTAASPPAAVSPAPGPSSTVAPPSRAADLPVASREARTQPGAASRPTRRQRTATHAAASRAAMPGDVPGRPIARLRHHVAAGTPVGIPSRVMVRAHTVRRGGEPKRSAFVRPLRRRAHPPSPGLPVPEVGTVEPPNPGGGRWVWVAALLAAVTAIGIGAAVRRRRRSGSPKVAPIIARNVALLPDNADLLRELDPAHRARVHDDRRRHLRAAPATARRRDVLPDRDRRERLEERPRGGSGRCRPEDVRRPTRRGGLAAAARPGRRDTRLLHSHDR